MKQFGQDNVLRTAEAGMQAYQAIRLELAQLPDHEPVELDFAGIQAVTLPFADESLCQLLAGSVSGYHEEHPLVVTGADRDVRETLAAAVERRRLAVLSLSSGDVHLLGGDPTLQGTLDAARSLDDEFNATDLAERLQLTAPGANNRLRALMRTGAVLRTPAVLAHGGKEFRYRLFEKQDSVRGERLMSSTPEPTREADTQRPGRRRATALQSSKIDA